MVKTIDLTKIKKKKVNRSDIFIIDLIESVRKNQITNSKLEPLLGVRTRHFQLNLLFSSGLKGDDFIFFDNTGFGLPIEMATGL